MIMNQISRDGKVYYSVYQELVSTPDSSFPRDILPSSLFYQLPLYMDGNEPYLLGNDMVCYLKEFYYIHSLYGSIMYYQ